MKGLCVLPVLILTACSSSSGNGSGQPISPPPPVVNQSPGGIWHGDRPNGTPIIVLISEAGDLRVLDPFGNQGFGVAVVANDTEFSVDYQLAPEFGGTLIDGSDSASCSFTGSLQERQSIDMVAACTTSLGTELGGPILLGYDPEYESGSSIARVAGTYDTSNGNVLTIDVNGALFVQDIATGCVINGEVSLIDVAWNLYGVEFVTEACQGEATPLNGLTWTGMATMTVVAGRDTVIAGLITDVSGLAAALNITLERI